MNLIKLNDSCVNNKNIYENVCEMPIKVRLSACSVHTHNTHTHNEFFGGPLYRGAPAAHRPLKGKQIKMRQNQLKINSTLRIQTKSRERKRTGEKTITFRWARKKVGNKF